MTQNTDNIEREKYQVLVVDDESLGRTRIHQLLADADEFSITKECENGLDAIEWLKHNNIDVIFLDIQMPEIDGFDVARATNDFYEKMNKADELPLIVFVTAYDQYAVEAFRVHAIDYLLKPLERYVFEETIIRLKKQLARRNSKEPMEKLRQLLEFQNQQTSKKYLSVKQNDRIYLLPFEDIQSIETEGNYLIINASAKEYRLRETVRNFIHRHNRNNFIQINRSTIINIDFILEIQTYFKGEFVILLPDKKQFITSAAFRQNLKDLI